MPLKDVFDQPETMWLQFRRRLDRVQPYCRIASHTEAEVRHILLALERIYRPSFPELSLRQWTGSIYTWLTHPLLDPQKSGRVIMDHLMKLLTLHRDVIRVIDTKGSIEEAKGQSEASTEETNEPNPK